MGVTVRQKTKGKGKPWWVFISHEGQRASKKVGDKKAADEVASQMRAKLKLGEFSFEEDKPAPTFKEYAESFLSGFSKINHKPSTHESYRSTLRNHLYPVFGSMPLTAIQKKDIKDFLMEMQQSTSLTPATIRNIRAYLSCILSHAADDEIIAVNPAIRTGKLIKKTDRRKEINPFSWEEKALFEKTVKEQFPRFYPLYLTDLRTGLRMGELIALKPGDIDFHNSCIEIRRNCVRGKIDTPKSGKIRRVDMSDECVAVLQKHLTNRKKETLKNGWSGEPEWLFYNRAGNLIDINGLRRRVFYKILEKAGLRRIRMHDLRHTYATLRISAGHNIADVSKQLGHHSINITVDTYYHWIPGNSRSEVNQLDNPEYEDGEKKKKKG